MMVGGVCADPCKISAMLSWPIPRTLKQLRGFLGLTGYYRCFVKNYATIAASLTELLKKDAFHWTIVVQSAFDYLKKVLAKLPMLHLLDFSKVFVIETDASKRGIGDVLMQEGHPLAYFSKNIRHQDAVGFYLCTRIICSYKGCGKMAPISFGEGIRHPN